MKTTAQGNLAETAVGNYLESKGYKIIDQNWRRKICEVDLIAKKEAIVYFVEVKYRRNDNQGDGLEYVTSSKIKQFKIAAGVWATENNFCGDIRLLAASVAPDSKGFPLVQNVVEIID